MAASETLVAKEFALLLNQSCPELKLHVRKFTTERLLLRRDGEWAELLVRRPIEDESKKIVELLTCVASRLVLATLCNEDVDTCKHELHYIRATIARMIGREKIDSIVDTLLEMHGKHPEWFLESEHLILHDARF